MVSKEGEYFEHLFPVTRVEWLVFSALRVQAAGQLVLSALQV